MKSIIYLPHDKNHPVSRRMVKQQKKSFDHPLKFKSDQRISEELLYYFLFTSDVPAIKATTNSTKKTKNKIFAIEAAPAAMPVNPKRAATNAITRKMSDQRNIVLVFS